MKYGNGEELARLCVKSSCLKIHGLAGEKEENFFQFFFSGKANLAGWRLARLISVGIASVSLLSKELAASICFTAIINLLLFNL